MNSHPGTIAPESASPTRIRGRRWILFKVDLKRERAWPLCMGRSRDWLKFRGARLAYPAVVEIDADEANAIARKGVLPVDNETLAGIARAVGCSRKLMSNILRTMTAEARCQSGINVPTPVARCLMWDSCPGCPGAGTWLGKPNSRSA